MWNYIFYIAFLKWKQSTEYDGTETYISDKIDNQDFGWFPILKSLSVEEEVEEEDKKTKEA